ncbi:MAG: hypothetical protein ABFD96_06810 [Armatimonadia bacterium]
MSDGAGMIGLAMFKASALAFSLLIAAYPFYRVVAMWFEGAINGSEAVIYLTTLLFLLLGIIVSWGTPLWILLFLALLVACIGVPLLTGLRDKMALRRMEDEDIHKFTTTLNQQPRNIYARERLSRIFLGRKEYDLALVHVKEALQVSPKETTLERLRERIETEQRRDLYHLKLCPKCAQENPPEAGACLSCGFLFVDPADILRVLWTEPVLLALKWTGLLLLGAALVLLLVNVAILLVTFLTGLGLVFVFWYLYVRFSRL